MKSIFKGIAYIVFVSCVSVSGFSQEASDSNYAFNMAVQYFSQYKFEDAIYWFDSSIKNKHHVAISYVYKAGAEILIGRIQEGKADLDIAFNMDSTIGAAYFYRARQFMAVDIRDSAIIFLKKAISLEPKEASYYDDLAYVYRSNNIIDSAKEYENEAIRLSRNAPMYINNLAAIEYQAGEYELALTHHNIALNRSFKITSQKDPVILIGIASCEWKLKKPQDALSKCEEIIRDHPDFSKAYVLRGLINYELGKKEQACADFLTASKIKDKSPENLGLKESKNHGCPIESKPSQ